MTLLRWILLSVLMSASVSVSAGEEADSATFEVWRARQEVRSHPYSYARVLARVAKGSVLSVLEERQAFRGTKRWAQVRVGETGPEGWTVLDSPPTRAGDPMASLGGRASPASLSLAAKAFEELSEQIVSVRPDVQRAFERILDAYVPPEELDRFDGGESVESSTPGGKRDEARAAAEPTRPGPDRSTDGAFPGRGSRSLEELLRARDRKRQELGSARTSVESYTEEDERAIGDATVRSLLSRVSTLPESSAVSAYIRKVGTSLARRSERSWLPWKFAVIESSRVNALSAPYGYVFITTGALRFVENEAELAFILAHEIAHVEKRHGLANLVRAYFDTAKRSARSRLDEMSRPLSPDRAVKRAELQGRMDELSDLVLKGFGLPQELESDRIGLQLLSRAGYSPGAALAVLQRMADAPKPTEEKPRIFRSHPDSGERLREARAAAIRLPPKGQTHRARFEEATKAIR